MSENPFPATGEYEYIRSVPVAFPRARQKYAVNASLFLLTILTTLFMGAAMMMEMEARSGIDPVNLLRQLFVQPELLLKGLPYSFAILAILLSHEMGHYLACRYYGIDATLPFFIPAPVYTGTFGAFIRIKSPFPNRKSLFDVGIAGPLAGFAVMLPFLYLGMKWSPQILPSQMPKGDYLYLGDPLIWDIFANRIWNPDLIPNAHPVAFAAWFACLATGLNLLPISQLDGGHVSYALFGKRAYVITWIFFAGVLGLAIHGFTISWISGSQWVVYSVMLLALRKMAGFRHPPTMDDESPIGWGRKVWGVIGLIVFVLTFIPVTIRP